VQNCDLLIINGSIVDGTGDPAYAGNIIVNDGKVAEITGPNERKPAKKVIDANGLTVTPGFIDIHTHCDRKVTEVPTVDNYVFQGVTTIIGGNCGFHPLPLSELKKEISKKGVSINFGCIAGHNAIRKEIMEFRDGPPTEDEMAKMKNLLEQEMMAGAFGLSTGLNYIPGAYSTTEEIVELASVAARYDGFYTTHMRNQGLFITEAIKEAIEIGERNSMPVQISHIKLANENVWNELSRILEPVEEARTRGVRVFLDQYPYTATSSGFSSRFPSWCFEGGREKFLERLQDEETYEKIKAEAGKHLSSEKGINKLETIYLSNYPEETSYEGKNLSQILKLRGKEPTIEDAADLLIEIQQCENAHGVFFQMDEKDVEDLMCLPYNMIGSDGGVQVPGEGSPHPRSYGTFPRVIARYVREKGILTLEEAIRKMTSLPSDALGLKDRGLIAEGMCADITIFDYEKFEDAATYENPHQYSKGLYHVIVNGHIVIENGEHNGTMAGKFLCRSDAGKCDDD